MRKEKFSMLQILDTGTSAAQANMDFDGRLLENLDPDGEPILHLYEWDGPSATYGYFANPDEHLYLEQAKRLGLSLGRRPTGGGIVFHIWDWAFSFLMPSSHPKFSLNTLENYWFVNGAVLEAVSEIFRVADSALIPESFPSISQECQKFCMAKPTQYDAVCRGKKIAGAAQRKRKQGYLHQGTVSLATPDFRFLRDVLRSTHVLEAMEGYTFAPVSSGREALEEARRKIRKKLIEKLMEKL